MSFERHSSPCFQPFQSEIAQLLVDTDCGAGHSSPISTAVSLSFLLVSRPALAKVPIPLLAWC